MFLLSSTPVMTASAAHHFGVPPTPLSLRFSRAFRSHSAKITPTDPYALFGSFSGIDPLGSYLHSDTAKNCRCRRRRATCC